MGKSLRWSQKPKKSPLPLFILGIDGLTLKNIQVGIKQGYLPSFQKLLEEGMIFQDKIEERLQGWIAHVKHGDTYKLRKDILEKLDIRFKNSKTQPQTN